MNNVQRLIDQRLGFAPWRCYDDVMRRLRCTDEEEYTQILPSCYISGLPQYSDCPIFACKFAQKPGYEHILALANEDGKMAIHDSSNVEERFGRRVHQNAIFDLAWMFDQMKLVTVSGDHTARLVDLSNAELRVTSIFNGHTRSVKTIAFKKDDSSVFATGSRDGSILCWDIRSTLSNTFSCDPDRRIRNAHFAKVRSTPTTKKKNSHISGHCISGANSVTGLVFQDNNTLISCSAGDGVIKVWDLRKTYRVHKMEPQARNVITYSGTTSKYGFSNLLLDKSCVRLYANCLDNTIYCYNVSTYSPEPIMQYVGHQNDSFYVKSCLSYDGQYLLSGSSDHNAYIWNTNSPTPLVKLKGHSAEVTCVAWCQKPEPTLITCSDDYRHKIWRIGPEILPENWEIHGRGCAESCTSKRSLETSRGKPRKKLKFCLDCNYSDKLCENCDGITTGKKRLATRLLENENKRIHSDDSCEPVEVEEKSLNDETIGCDEEPKSKKVKYDLIGLNCDIDNAGRDDENGENDETSKLHRDHQLETSENIDICYSPKRTMSPEDSPRCTCPTEESNKNHESIDCIRHRQQTPTSNNHGHRKMRPYDRELVSPEREIPSPTTNLPNFVIDGCVPHLSYSPPKRPDRDWLTKLRVEKSLIHRMQEINGQSTSPKSPTGEHSPRNRSAKKQASKRSSSQSPLLNFFRVTNNSIMKDSHCVSKSSLTQTPPKRLNK